MAGGCHILQMFCCDLQNQNLLLMLVFVPLCLRYTASSFRAADDRLPYGSLPRLNDQSQSRHCSTNRLDSLSRHGSTQRLESQSRHSSVRDLSSTAQAVYCAPGNGIHRVLEEDGATA